MSRRRLIGGSGGSRVRGRKRGLGAIRVLGRDDNQIRGFEERSRGGKGKNKISSIIARFEYVLVSFGLFLVCLIRLSLF